jgi:cell wall-associated NlpC family hydrolase
MRFSCRPVAGAWATAALVTAALIPAVLVPAALAAPAAPRTDVVGDARQEATDLRLRVDALQLQAEQASENYDAAYDALGRAVTAHVAAGRQLDVARASADATDGQAGRRVRALYMAGGGTGLYASVLNSGDLPDALRRLHQVDAVLVGDHRAAADAGQAFAQRRTADAHLQAAALTAVRLQRTVADRADVVRALLAQTDALMAHADARVVALAAQQRLDEQAAAARRAAVVLAAAQARAAAALTASQARAAAALTAAQARAAASPAVPQARGERQRGVAPNPGSLLPATDPTAPGPASTSPGPASTASVAAVLDFARAQLGKPYVWGATGPDSYDCSGLTQAAYAAAGARLPRIAQDQWFAGPHVELGALQPGDLLFWASDTSAPATIHHVALYLGSGQILAAPHTGDVVKIEPLYLTGYIGAVRPVLAR